MSTPAETGALTKAQLLAELAAVAGLIRENNGATDRLSARRAELVRTQIEDGPTGMEMAEALGVTHSFVYRIMRKGSA